MTKSDAIAEIMELPEAPKVSVVRVEPGDVICLEFPGPISEETAQRIKKYAEQLWPNNRLAVVGYGGTFKVMKGNGK